MMTPPKPDSTITVLVVETPDRMSRDEMLANIREAAKFKGHDTDSPMFRKYCENCTGYSLDEADDMDLMKIRQRLEEDDDMEEEEEDEDVSALPMKDMHAKVAGLLEECMKMDDPTKMKSSVKKALRMLKKG